MPYTETLAENYLQAKEAERVNAQSGEDPLFTAIAGDSKEFVGGIPKETWDTISPDQKDTMIRGTEGDRRRAGYIGAGIAGGLGVAAGIPISSINPTAGTLTSGVLGSAGAAWGYNTGYDLLDMATPPQQANRDILQKQFEHAKEHD